MTQQPDTTPDLTTFAVLHRGMRRDTLRLARALAEVTPADQAERLPAIGRWYAGFVHELHDHHTIEDEIFFPALSDRLPEYGAYTARLATDHVHLDTLLTETAKAIGRLAEADDFGAAQTDAADAAADLAAFVHVHLGFEDDEVLPLYVRHFSAEEYVAMEQRAQKSVGVRNLVFTVPWAIASATDEQREHLLASVPLPFKVLWYATRGRYRRLTGRAFAGVELEVAA